MSILVAKADGTSEAFEVSKLRSSLKRAGAEKGAIEQISAEIEKGLYNGISTSEIYRRAFARLREHRGVAARYSLKRAVLEFGPSGFPFEVYLAELFRAQGYSAATDQIIQGACVEHEVDVVVRPKAGKVASPIIYVEAKFHNTIGFKTDLKTVLYVKARIDDIRATTTDPVQGLVVTNTKFTEKAVQYSTCAGLDLLGWEYPAKNNLHDRVVAARLYPITALTSLSKREKTALLNENKVLCNALRADGEVLERVGIRGRRADAVLEEVGALCVPGKDI
jgi:hypothetical protein